VQLIGAPLALTFLVTELSPLQRIFDTVSLDMLRCPRRVVVTR
jgi:hypothetical protein